MKQLIPDNCEKKTVQIVLESGKFYCHPLFVLVYISTGPPEVTENLVRNSVVSYEPMLYPAMFFGKRPSYFWMQPNESFLFIEHYPAWGRILMLSGQAGWVYTSRLLPEIYEDPSKS